MAPRGTNFFSSGEFIIVDFSGSKLFADELGRDDFSHLVN
jgi:hypothetical protein